MTSYNKWVVQSIVNNILALLQFLFCLLASNLANDVRFGALKNCLCGFENLSSLLLSSIGSLKSLLLECLFIFVIHLVDNFDCFLCDFFAGSNCSVGDGILGGVERFQNIELLLILLLSLVNCVVLCQHLLEWLIEEIFFFCFSL
jgi:hypothetical protein